MPRPPWTCPKCGRKLTIRNQEHVCGLYDLETHFEGKDLIGKITFEWMCKVFDSLGLYEVLPMKTTIAFASGGNLAFLTTKKRGAVLSVVLDGIVASARFYAEVPYSRTKTIYRAQIREESELDTEVEDWLRKAYSSGAK